MPKPLQTTHILPDVSGRRFGQFALGYDRVEELREEHGELRVVAADACGVEPLDLTREHLVGHRAAVLERSQRDLPTATENLKKSVDHLFELVETKAPAESLRGCAADLAKWAYAVARLGVQQSV